MTWGRSRDAFVKWLTTDQQLTFNVTSTCSYYVGVECYYNYRTMRKDTKESGRVKANIFLAYYFFRWQYDVVLVLLCFSSTELVWLSPVITHARLFARQSRHTYHVAANNGLPQWLHVAKYKQRTTRPGWHAYHASN